MSMDLCVSVFGAHDVSVRRRAWKTAQTEGGHHIVRYIYIVVYT